MSHDEAPNVFHVIHSAKCTLTPAETTQLRQYGDDNDDNDENDDNDYYADNDYFDDYYNDDDYDDYNDNGD